ncbi:MAG: type I methionyl aminopeptidase [Bdellovibrionales bacterium RIFOXYD1_FULL_44_7]|nr:MAG: type I methionyl aminopeptidase [Bdellovibrionales bacterium RIFOXYD1_FULL_44_7]
MKSVKAACKIVGRILCELCEAVKPGMSTADVDKIAERRCFELGAIPAFKGYHGYPASICISLNDEVIHGIPSSKRIIKSGDLVSIDFGVMKDGWFGDAAKTLAVGEFSDEARKLMEVTAESLNKGIEQCRPGNHLFDIGHAIQNYVEAFGYGVVREFVGHGIGRALHEEPQVPNFGAKGKGLELKAGMVLAIEPMINAGSPKVKILKDGWTAVTEDHSLSAHFEHTVAITSNGPEILTVVD